MESLLTLVLSFLLLFQAGLGQNKDALSELDLGQSNEQQIVIPSDRDGDEQLNDVPIIGILAQEISYHLNSKYPGEYKSFIAASYVKFVEGGGARVIPIWIDKPKEYYVDIMSKINGVLFPGGATWFNQSDGYADAGWYIYQRAKELNDAGEYFPIWGTCLGFELLTYLDADRNEHRDDCSSHNQGLPLEFKRDFKSSRLYEHAPDQVIHILGLRPVTSNFHQFCVTEKALEDAGIAANWKVLTTNRDWNGFKFISSMEHTKYPFYGVQFHPEKNIYEWVTNRNISHSLEAIRANQYFAEFFVEEARKSSHTFTDGLPEEQQHLIYNYPTTYTRLVKSAYEQCYLFPEGTDYVKGNAMRLISTLLAFFMPILLLTAAR